MNEYTAFDSELSVCRKCESILAAISVNPSVSTACVEPPPIVSGIRSKPILLIGQAPGITEYQTRKPFQGSAGQKIREILREAGVADFDGRSWWNFGAAPQTAGAASDDQVLCSVGQSPGSPAGQPSWGGGCAGS